MSTARVEGDIAVRSVGTDRLSAPSVAFAQRRAKINLNWKWIRSASLEMERRFTFIAIWRCVRRWQRLLPRLQSTST
jgi:hypothetical protein